MDPVERDLLIVAAGSDAARRPGGEIEQRADGAPGALARPEFEHLAQQHEDRDHRGGLEIDRDAAAGGMEAGGEQSGRNRGDDAVDPGRTGTEGDQREHVEAAANQRIPAASEEREPGPQHDRRGQDELQPVRVEAGMREHFQRDNRDGQRGADPQAPAHVGEFRIGLRFGADGQRLQRHPADRTTAGADLAHLGVHRAGVGGRRVGSRFVARRQVLVRVGGEFLAAAGAAEMEHAAVQLEAMARCGGIDSHAADRVGCRVTIRHRGCVVIVTVHRLIPCCAPASATVDIPLRGKVARCTMRQSNPWRHG